MKQILMMSAVLCSTMLFVIRTREHPKSRNYMYLWVIAVTLFIAFSKVGPMLYSGMDWTIDNWRNNGVLLFMGLVPVAWIIIIYVFLRGGLQENKDFLEEAILALAVAVFIGRVGCLFDKCCYGEVCVQSDFWAMWNPKLQAYSINVVAQELVLIGAFIIFKLVPYVKVEWKGIYFLIAFAVFRFVTDPQRTDHQPRGWFGDWGHAQELSVVLFLLGILLLLHVKSFAKHIKSEL